jgi:hypothetical protein
MTNSQTIGIDTAKRVFFLHGENTGGRVFLRKKLSRASSAPAHPLLWAAARSS